MAGIIWMDGMTYRCKSLQISDRTKDGGMIYMEAEVITGIEPVGPGKGLQALNTGAKLERTDVIGVNLPDDRTVVLTPTAMVFSPSCSYNTWKARGTQMSNVIETFSKHLRWWIGDWIIYGETVWPDKYTQALEESMYSYGTLRNCVYVCRKIPRENRRETLSFEHHYQVCSMTEDERDHWLNLAENNNWSLAEFKRAIKGKEINVPMDLHVDGVNLSDPQHKYDRRLINVNLKWRDWDDFIEENLESISTMAVKEAAEFAFKQARER